MNTWRDSEADYWELDKAEYRVLDQEKLRALETSLLELFAAYPSQDQMSHHSYTSEQGCAQNQLELRYGDVVENAYEQLVWMDVDLTLQHQIYEQYAVKEQYNVDIVRQIHTESIKEQPVHDGVYVQTEAYQNPVLVERYTLVQFSGGDWEAYIKQADLTHDGQLIERSMLSYDVKQLEAELQRVKAPHHAADA